MKNVYLIDLASGSNMNLLPLSIGLVGSYSMAQLDLAETFDFNFQFLRGEHRAKVDAMIDPTVVGFACYIWNVQGSLRLARFVKQRFPATKIVLGGFSIPKVPDRVSAFFRENPFVDILVHGEGEVVFANLLRRLQQGDDVSDVKGITFRTDDVEKGFVSTPQQPRIADLDQIPSPFLNGVFDKIMDQYGHAITGALWETNRGCPYSCTFCDWGGADVNKVKKYDMDRLKSELDWISRRDFFYMFVSDANFGIFLERDMEIAGWVADNCGKFGSPQHVVTNWAKNKHEQVVAIADRLAQGGVASNITLAVQSYHQPTLKAIKRRNIKHSEMLNLKSAFHDRNLPTYMEIILGLPEETYDSFVSGLNQALTPRISDRFFVYICQLLENTELASAESRKTYKIESRHCWHTVSNRKFEDMEDRELEEFIVGTSTMPVDDWGRAYLAGYLLTVLYNHRVAFFVLCYLRHAHGCVITDVVEFILKKWRTNPAGYPQLFKGIDHLDRQHQLILDGDSYMTGLEGYEDLIMLPAAAAVSLMISGSDRLYEDIRGLVEEFCAHSKLKPDSMELDDVFKYQKARMPAWPISQERRFQFNTSIPEYFELLTSGLEPEDIVTKKLTLCIEGLDRSPGSFQEFAATLVRGSLAVDLLNIRIEQGWAPAEHQDSLKRIDRSLRKRHLIEQNSINKLKHEFRKLQANP